MLAGGELSPPSLHPGAQLPSSFPELLGSGIAPFPSQASLPAVLLSGGEPSAQHLMSPGFAGSSDPHGAPGPCLLLWWWLRAMRGFSSVLAARLGFSCARCLLLVLVLLSHHSSCNRKAAAPHVLLSSFPWLAPWSRVQLQESHWEEARGPMASAGPLQSSAPPCRAAFNPFLSSLPHQRPGMPPGSRMPMAGLQVGPPGAPPYGAASPMRPGLPQSMMDPFRKRLLTPQAQPPLATQRRG